MKMNVTRTITTVLLILFFTLPALATEIKGKVVDVEALRAKIAYESDFAPREGDKVQIGFEFGEDFIPVEGEWKIVKVNIDFLWAESKSADSGTPALNYLAVIQSDNPQKREVNNGFDHKRILNKYSDSYQIYIFCGSIERRLRPQFSILEEKENPFPWLKKIADGNHKEGWVLYKVIIERL